MSNVHPTRHICHSSTVEGYRCYILRAICLRSPPRLSWEFIGVSLPGATVRRREVGAWRPVLSHCIASPNQYGRRVRPKLSLRLGHSHHEDLGAGGPGRSGRGYADFHVGVNFSITEF
jgi:hypothetical protein